MAECDSVLVSFELQTWLMFHNYCGKEITVHYMDLSVDLMYGLRMDLKYGFNSYFAVRIKHVSHLMYKYCDNNE